MSVYDNLFEFTFATLNEFLSNLLMEIWSFDEFMEFSVATSGIIQLDWEHHALKFMRHIVTDATYT